MPADLSALPLPVAVLFDLDGTLIDTVETRIAAWLEALGGAGFPTTRERLAPLICLDGRRLAREIAALAGETIDDARAEEIDRQCGEIYQGLNRAPRPLPGVLELGRALLDAGLEVPSLLGEESLAGFAQRLPLGDKRRQRLPGPLEQCGQGGRIGLSFPESGSLGFEVPEKRDDRCLVSRRLHRPPP